MKHEQAVSATVTGNDQQVGFRAMVMKQAIQYNLAGTAENEQDEVVRFTLQGDGKRLRPCDRGDPGRNQEIVEYRGRYDPATAQGGVRVQGSPRNCPESGRRPAFQCEPKEGLPLAPAGQSSSRRASAGRYFRLFRAMQSFVSFNRSRRPMRLKDKHCEKARRRAMKAKLFPDIARSFEPRVQPFEFDAGVFGCELPIGFGVVLVSVALPRGHFFLEGLLAGDAAAQALPDQNGEFGFGLSSQLPCLGV